MNFFRTLAFVVAVTTTSLLGGYVGACYFDWSQRVNEQESQRAIAEQREMLLDQYHGNGLYRDRVPPQMQQRPFNDFYDVIPAKV